MKASIKILVNGKSLASGMINHIGLTHIQHFLGDGVHEAELSTTEKTEKVTLDKEGVAKVVDWDTRFDILLYKQKADKRGVYIINAEIRKKELTQKQSNSNIEQGEPKRSRTKVK
jgi:hypothetical protein